MAYCWLKNRLLLNTYLLYGPICGFRMDGQACMCTRVPTHLCVRVSLYGETG